MDLRQLGDVRRWLPLVVLGGLIAGVVAFAVLSVQPRVYEASATLKLGQTLSGSPILLTPVSDRLLTEYAYRATSRPTLAQVAGDLGLEARTSELQQRVTAVVEPTSTLLTVTARAESAEEASDLANAIGDSLLATSAAAQGSSPIQQALIDDIEAIREEISVTRTEIAELNALPAPAEADLARIDELEDLLVTLIATHGDVLDRLLATGAHSLSFVAPAEPPDEPIEPRLLLYTGLAVLAGLLVGAALAVALQSLDQTIRRPRELEETTGLPTLGMLVELSKDAERGGGNRLVTIHDPRSAVADEYRRLRANLEAAKGAPLRTLLVTASEPALGSAVTAANLAVAFAESGRRVVLIDGNLRWPGLHAIFGVPNEHGLATLSEYDVSALQRAQLPTLMPNLSVIPAGPPGLNAARALSLPRMRAIIAELSRDHDVVIADSPPLPRVSDALVLGAELRDALLVVSQGKTRRGDIQAALDALRLARAEVLGTAFFRRRRGASRPAGPVPTAPAPGQPQASGDVLGRVRST